MEKRVLLAVVLSFLVIYGYQSLFLKPGPRQSARAPEPQQAGPAGATQAQAAAPQVIEKPSEETAAVPVSAEADVLVGDTVERPVVVENDWIRAEFTNRGGVLRRWLLKRHRSGASGAEVNLTPSVIPAGSFAPFSLSTDDPAVTAALAGALYKSSTLELHPAPGTGDALRFEYRLAAGLAAVKEFTFGPGPYEITLRAEVTQGDGQPLPLVVHSGAGLGDGDGAVTASRSFFSPNYQQPTEGIEYRDGKVQRHAAATLGQQLPLQGRFAFVGMDDHYFLHALVPGDETVTVHYSTVTVENRATPLVDYAVQLPGSAAAHYFFGPKDFDLLQRAHPELVRVINFGMFDFIVVPLLKALKWVNGFVGNYGWSIIILTVLINLAMFPLRHKSVVSMRKMQEIQPLVKGIQDRYAHLKTTDPERAKMNQELMSLYRERGVNPASGCVPMLLTLPVLFAFYAMLSQAIELRGAPFVGWIRDLSTHDPYYVTPILMGITMVWQQKITPSTADPVQQKVMMFMPVMFTFMFLWAPSGLVIYWFVSNLWSIGQQYVTNALIGPPKVPRPPAERRVRRPQEA